MQLLDVYTRLDQNTLLLVLLIISPVSLSAAPFTSEQTTIAQCQEIQCEPVTCASPVHLDGECCPICIAPDLTAGPKSCVYEGLYVPHGDIFHPPSMLNAYEEERKTGDNQTSAQNTSSSVNPYCTKCSCNDGSVECDDISSTCPTLRCNASEAVVPERSCCPSCPSVPDTTQDPGAGCYDFDGTFYPEGDSWHPTLPGQGIVTCLNCSCINGVTRCQRLPCPPVPTCGPDDPVELDVLCCPKCNRPVNPPSVSPATTATDRSVSPATTATDRSVSPVTVPATGTTEDFAPRLVPCTPDENYIIKVYKHPTLDAMAIENTDTNGVELYKWVQEANENGEMVLKRVYEETTSQEFTQQHRTNYTFVGYTIERRVNGLRTRESKRNKIEQCTENCSIMVVNMLRVVSVVPCSDERK